MTTAEARSESSDSSAIFLFDSVGDSCKSEPSLMVKTTAKEESLFANEARFGLLEITPFECVELCFS
jgi:hypothetical protein